MPNARRQLTSPQAALLQYEPRILESPRIGRFRCAVIECYNRHDEVYLTTVHLLERLGYEVHLFNTWRNRVKKSFVHTQELRPYVHSRLNAEAVLRAAVREKFDLVVFNTLEGSRVVECAERIAAHTPVLGFVHNASFVTERPEYRGLLRNARVKLMLLAPYVAQHISRVADAGYIYPVYFYDREPPRLRQTSGKRRFCVQGYFDPTRRHYDLLLDAVAALRQERDDFEVLVMGRSLTRRFRTFERSVHSLGLAEVIRYSWKGIGYRSYHRQLNSTDFILPLISPDSHPAYFRSKSTSSIAAAVGFCKVPVVHEQLAEFYGIRDLSFTYTQDLLAAMRAALDTDAGELARLTQRVAMTRDTFLDESLDQMRNAITQTSAPMAI